ncbi:MAG: hypothetical protein KF891_19690 [Rhizobacter sp.]|nr:hypothetical protein [Rhizobacter sp.]
MSIVVYWLEPDGTPAHQSFAASDLLPALQFSESRRREGRRHVCISSELADSVGRGGVQSVDAGKLPDGQVYDFNKSHRGGGPGSGQR